ncbi:GNAT family N-acetyltransferase [Streptacidiphilus jiangxiensis]|uniref:Predicted acetyltransferase n=1 Tax=Streptacidiphilus jiangxiensis TaxID=235985 RepID=A0A1H7Y2H7_STRJI|nr:GNAT family N-acetyltransferase [Streptacidiphilus jiangxiensis]SEM40161.1 Predicted acetyltransferase [Streptacidiphilus jiangxiensis]
MGQSAHDIEIRVIGDEELGAWGQALNAGFMRPMADGRPDFQRRRFQLGRALGAFDGARCVGTFRSFEKELTVPGGATLTADAVTNVTVSATHRRRGLLNRMMRQDLDAAVARGEAFAMLIAAEFGIYGRYGFGPATAQQGKVIDKQRYGGIRVPAASDQGSIELLTMAEMGKIGPELHERFRRTRPGVVSRDTVDWQFKTGELLNPDRAFKEPLVALYRDAAGTPAGLLAYRVTDDDWRNWVPRTTTLKVDDYFAVDWAAEAALWRYALQVDWIQRVEVWDLAPDSPLPLALHDQRACVDNDDSTGDFLWVRILDVAKAFSARTYDAPGRVVLDVTDRMGYTDGRFVLDAAADGTGVCEAADAADGEVDFAIDVSELAAVYFGHQPLARLAQAGLLEQRRAGGLDAAQRVLRTAQAPWCPDVF